MRLSIEEQRRILSSLQTHWVWLRRYESPPRGRTQEVAFHEDLLVHEIMNLMCECRSEAMAEKTQSGRLLRRVSGAVTDLAYLRAGRRIP